MKIKAKQEVEVEITEIQKYLITIDFLCEVFDWDEDFFIEEGWLCKREMAYGSHSFQRTVKVREVTKKDQCVYDLFKDLKKKPV